METRLRMILTADDLDTHVPRPGGPELGVHLAATADGGKAMVSRPVGEK